MYRGKELPHLLHMVAISTQGFKGIMLQGYLLLNKKMPNNFAEYIGCLILKQIVHEAILY